MYNQLQKELERARMEQESATTEKQNLEKRLQDESLGLHTSYSDLEVSQLKAEIEVNVVLHLFYVYHVCKLIYCYQFIYLADVEIRITTC